MRTLSALVRYSPLPFCQIWSNGLESLISLPWLAMHLQKSALWRIPAQEKNKDRSLLRINSKIIVFNQRTFPLSKIQLRLLWSYFLAVLLRMPLSNTKLWLCQHSTMFLLSDMQLWLSTTRLPLRDMQSRKNNLLCFSVMCSCRYLIAIPSHDCLKKPCHVSPQQYTDMSIPKSHDQLWMHCHVFPLSSILQCLPQCATLCIPRRHTATSTSHEVDVTPIQVLVWQTQTNSSYSHSICCGLIWKMAKHHTVIHSLLHLPMG